MRRILIALFVAGSATASFSLATATHDLPKPVSIAAWPIDTVSIPAPSPTPSIATPSELSVIGLGDSVTAGSACDCVSFIDQYARSLGSSTHLKATSNNLGVPGQTSRELLSSLQNDSSVQSAVAQSNVIVITIGANDFSFDSYSPSSCANLSCYSQSLTSLTSNLQSISLQISKLRNGRPTLILDTGYWEIWEDGSVGRSNGQQYMSVGDALTHHVNQIIQQVSNGSGATYVDLYTAFRGTNGTVDDTDFLASDGDHPNAAGHALISQWLMSAGTKPLL
ncbi:MAG: SGNH/GDSL hydrolase family protein [Actinomycetota bacterium]